MNSKLLSYVEVKTAPAGPGSAKVRDDGDTRSAALLNLLAVIADMNSPPRYWLMENVAGFCDTNSWRKMHAVLGGLGYHVEEYLLCPSELLGVPNIRLRYYCVAVLRDGAADRGCSDFRANPASAPTLASTCMPTADGGKQDDRVSRRLPSPAATATGAARSACPKPLSSYLVPSDTTVAPEAIIDAQALYKKSPTFRFEIVGGDAALTSCFTKSYSKGFFRTGALLDMTSDSSSWLEPEPEPELEPERDANRVHSVVLGREPAPEAGYCSGRRFVCLSGKERLRRLLPCEIMRLLHYPGDFCWPRGVSIQDQWRLLGNGLHIGVVGHVLEHLLVHMGQDGTAANIEA